MAQPQRLRGGVGRIRPKPTGRRSRPPATSCARVSAGTLHPRRARGRRHRALRRRRCRRPASGPSRCGVATPPGTRARAPRRCRSRFATTPSRRQLGFEPPSATDPTLVAVSVTDTHLGRRSRRDRDQPGRLGHLAGAPDRARRAADWSHASTTLLCRQARISFGLAPRTRRATRRRRTGGSTGSRWASPCRSGSARLCAPASSACASSGGSSTVRASAASCVVGRRSSSRPRASALEAGRASPGGSSIGTARASPAPRCACSRARPSARSSSSPRCRPAPTGASATTLTGSTSRTLRFAFPGSPLVLPAERAIG